MKKWILSAFLACVAFDSQAQYLHLLHTVSFPTVTNQYGVVGSSDCWGWQDSLGVDYAIIGNKDNVAFVRASDGQVLDQVVAPANNDPYYHRDFKTYGHYAFLVGECKGTNEGMTVVDLQYLPDSVHLVMAWTNNGSMIRNHNISIDTGTGHAYLESDEFIGAHGVDIVDIRDPYNPVKVGFINTPGVHDMFARNDTVWVAEGSTPAYSIWDCSDKQNPTLLGRINQTSFGYCHNVWASDDGKFFFTAEETGNKTVKVWDATDMQNIVQRGQYLGPNNLVHNVHVKGNYLFMSHYTSGVRVVDWSDPDFPVEVASYDTYPANNSTSFHGCWGVYPHSNSNFVYGSTMEGQLFIFEWLPTTVSNDIQISDEPLQVWPNPSSDRFNFLIEQSTPSQVSVSISDLQGKTIETIFDGWLETGTYTLPWSPAAALPSGTYLLVLDNSNGTITKKVTVQR